MRPLLALLVALACACGAPVVRRVATGRDGEGGGRGPTSTGGVHVVPSEGAINRPPEATAPTGDASGSGTAPAEAAAEIVSIGPQTTPDPIVRHGRSGGPNPARDYSPECRGYIADAPSFLLKVDAPMPDLRILVSMPGDATLVVQLADGRWLCNDDSEGLNPIIDDGFPAGRHRVWVGAYSTSGVGTPYTIAFTRQPGLTTGQLPPPPPPAP